jgi:hypothetical protein
MENKEVFKPELVNPELAPKSSLDLSGITTTKEDKENFFKSFLADKPFTDAYSLMNGAFTVKFKTLTVTENADVLKQVVKDQDDGIAKNNDGYFIQIMLYRLGVSVVEINNLPFLPTITKDSCKEENYVAVRAREFSNWPIYKLVGLQTVFRTFENKVLKLTNCLEEPDFWKANA